MNTIIQRIIGVYSVVLLCMVQSALAWQDIREEPFVKGGAYDKPYLYKIASGRAALGGYAETHFRFERKEGVTEKLTFLPKRFNLFMHANISERVRMAAELEFEEGTEEILLELAVLDFQLHRALTFRGGMLLSPLGKFNLAHDSPANKMTDRPLVSTQIIPVALSEPGMGIFGALFPSKQSRITYELYAVNGFTSDIIEESPDGTRIAQGKNNIEDNNNSPAFVGRIGYSPLPDADLGFSWHTGKYNVTEIDGLTVDEGRFLTILALDGEIRKGPYEILGEYAHASIDIPQNLSGSIFSGEQAGIYLQGSAEFFHDLLPTLPGSYFEGVVRYDRVDFDTNTEGDTHVRLTAGLNFRPTSDSALKLDYVYNWLRDGLNVETNSAGILFSFATYF